MLARMGTARRRWMQVALSGLAGLAPSFSGHAAEPLHLVTGALPPFSMADDATEPGVLVEVAVEAARRAGWPLRPVFQPWARAVLTAQQQPRTLVVPLTRTPEREAQFQWIARIGLQDFGFLNLAGATRIGSLAQARALKVGVLRGSPHAKRLAELGFEAARIALASSNDDLQRMLDLQMVDAVYGSLPINLYNARRLGRKAEALQVGWVVETGEIWLAAGSGLGAAEIDALRHAVAAMERDGAMQRLYQRYGLTPPPAAAPG